MHTAAMLDYECLNCSWVKAHILDESIVVKKYGDFSILEKWESYGDFSIYFIIYMAAMLVFGSRWSMGVLHYLT